MAKSFVHINKIKTYGTLKSRWNHDLNVGFRMALSGNDKNLTIKFSSFNYFMVIKTWRNRTV